MSTAETRVLLLNTAERLFAEHGFAATSLRHIITDAGVNLAAVHYHFGSKDGLIRAVLERRIGQLNAERLRRLEAVQASKSRGTRRMEDLLEALVGPPLRMSRDPDQGGKYFMRLLGRTFMEANPELHQMFLGMFSEVVDKFRAALMEACPHLDATELFWRGHFVVGAMAHTMCEQTAVKMYGTPGCEDENVEKIIRHLVRFTASGMKAPSIHPPKSPRRKKAK